MRKTIAPTAKSPTIVVLNDVGIGLLEAALPTLRKSGADAGLASALCNLGAAHWRAGEYARANGLLEESLALAREVGDLWIIAMRLYGLGQRAQERGDYQQTCLRFREGLVVQQELGAKRLGQGALGAAVLLEQSFEAVLGLGIAHAVDGTLLRCGEDVGNAEVVTVDDDLFGLLRGDRARRKEQGGKDGPGKEQPKHEGLRKRTAEWSETTGGYLTGSGR